MKPGKLLLTLILFVVVFPTEILAYSPYVLPYPSDMPGSKFYAINQFQEFALQFWYFGDLGSFEYNRRYADKYLVEAKTLFEYRQYMLGVQALEMSDMYFKRMSGNLESAKQHNKDISEKARVLEEIRLKHREVLEKIESENPSKIVWSEENSEEVILNMREVIDASLQIRS